MILAQTESKIGRQIWLLHYFLVVAILVKALDTACLEFSVSQHVGRDSRPTFGSPKSDF